VIKDIPATFEQIAWNNQVRLAISDVDETIADVYTQADPAIIHELSRFLKDGGKLFMVSGGGLARIQADITNLIEPKLRQSILISHCSGAEVWGFEPSGDLRSKPFYSVYENRFTPDLKKLWREVVAELLEEFNLIPHPVCPKLKFLETIGRDPHDIMYDDRGPQITLELINAYDLSDEQLKQIGREVPYTHGQRDLRIPLMERAEQLFAKADIPITPRLGGTFALDFAVEGSSKTTSIKQALGSPKILATIDLKPSDLSNPKNIEVWGDKYSVLRGGTDRHMSEALPPTVRSIDFRQEDPAEFLEGYNTVVWDGEKHLHHGLLEYLRSRPLAI
jgi:hypothetical protein